jgi:FixJ family two-component response regulator
MNPVHLNLYIVDDDEAVREGLGNQFIARGYAVRAFRSGELFLTAVSAASEGVVILDLRMDPGMGGIAVFNVLRSMSCPLLVLFLSGHGTIPQAVQAVKEGAYGWLPKPCDESELLEQVQLAMQAATAKSIQRSNQRVAWQLWETLTPREVDTALLDALGKSAKEIAKLLTERDTSHPINYRTIENHRSSVYSKLEVENSNELQKFLRDNNLSDI